MHACGCKSSCMRTTIEISVTQRAALLRLAADRGEKGFSRIVSEAIEAYLSGRGSADRAGAVRLRGILSEKEADAYRSRIQGIRENWR